MGVMYGHLGILLTTEQYKTLSEQEIEAPNNPGLSTPSDRGTKSQIRAARDLLKDSH